MKLKSIYYFQVETRGGLILIMCQESSGRAISGALAFKTCCDSKILTKTIECVGCGSPSPYEKPFLRFYDASWNALAETGRIWAPDDIIIDYLVPRLSKIDIMDAILGADELCTMLKTIMDITPKNFWNKK